MQHSKGGLSFEAFAGVIEVDRKTLYNWVDAHPEFKQAKEIAWACCLKFWESFGLTAAMGGDITYVDPETKEKKKRPIKNFNAAHWIFTMKCRFGWKEPDDTKKDPAPKPTDIDETKLDDLTDDDLRVLAKLRKK